MPELDGASATMIVGILSALGLILSARVKAGADSKNARGPEWDSFTEKMQSWTEAQLAERDKRIERLQTDMRKVKDELSEERSKRRELERELGTEQDKRKALVAHVQDWRESQPDQSTWPRLPPILRDDLAT